jgi:hypothetical protein
MSRYPDGRVHSFAALLEDLATIGQRHNVRNFFPETLIVFRV